MSKADQIRAFIIHRLIAPARAAGRAEIVIRAGDVHAAMGLHQSMPNVCQVLSGDRLAAEAGIEQIGLKPPSPKANAFFSFRILDISRVHKGLTAGSRTSMEHPGTSAVAKECTSGRIRANAGVRNSASLEDIGQALVLVSCVKSKGAAPAQAQDLYTSALFKGMRSLAERGSDWRILSAEHGLVHPQAVIEPYEKTLNTMPLAARRVWAERVLEELLPLAKIHGHVVVLAGSRYREHIVPALVEAGIMVSIPMARMAFGHQLAWLARQA